MLSSKEYGYFNVQVKLQIISTLWKIGTWVRLQETSPPGKTLVVR